MRRFFLLVRRLLLLASTAMLGLGCVVFPLMALYVLFMWRGPGRLFTAATAFLMALASAGSFARQLRRLRAQRS